MTTIKPEPQEVEAALEAADSIDRIGYKCDGAREHLSVLAAEVRRLRASPSAAVLAAAWEVRHAYFSAAPKKAQQERLRKSVWALAHILGEHLTYSTPQPSRGEIEARVLDDCISWFEADGRTITADEIREYCRAKAAAAKDSAARTQKDGV